MTTPADNVGDAYFDSLWRHDEDVWTHPGTYIPRRLAQAGPMVPVHLRLRDELLRARGDLKRILTGQVGAGKSTELHQLFHELQPMHADPKTKLRLELARIRDSELDDKQRELTAALLVVEYSNDAQWYDVHPLLRPEYDLRLQRRAERLGVSPSDAAPLVAELLNQLGD